MTRDETILSLKTLVLQIARARKRSLPINVEFDDLVAAGWLGAIDAVDRYDPERHVALPAYAEWRIRGAMIDYLRQQDPLSRDHRRAVTLANEAAPLTFSINQRRFDDGEDYEHQLPDPHAARNLVAIEARRVVEEIFRRAQGVSARDVRIMTSYYQRGATMREIAVAEGVTESRVSQLAARTMRQLRAAA